MPLKKPVAVSDLPRISKPAAALATHFADIELAKFKTKLRFTTGCVSVLSAIAIFFVGHSLFVGQYFGPEFVDRSWYLTIALLVLGAAFTGKEVVEGLVSGLKSAGIFNSY